MIRLIHPARLLVLGVFLALWWVGSGVFSARASDPDAVPSTVAPYLDGWSVVHADHANTNYVSVDGPADVELLWGRKLQGSVYIGPLPWTINLGPTVDADQVYVSSTVTGCYLQALDAATGETRWCAQDLDPFAVASAPSLDQDGRLFLADGAAMHAFERSGTELWETPIAGVPFSAQFTSQGHLIFITHIGNIMVLDRDTGAPVLPTFELISGATWNPATGLNACKQGTQDCPVANTPAVDPATGRFFFTFWEPGASQASVRAMTYSDDPEPALAPLWANSALPGGSGSSPVLSGDGSRVYVTDNAGSLHALDAETGDELWSIPIGYAAGGSPSLSPDGLIVPAGGGSSPLLAIRDTGASGVTAWRHDEMLNRGGTTQTGADRVYVTIDAGQYRCDLVVLDRATGAEIDREPLPDTCVFSVGTSVGLDGTIYVATIVGGVYAFVAAPDNDGDGVSDAGDNCPNDPNAAQLNTDGNFIDQTPPSSQDDRTWPNSDAAGDACDPDDDNDGLTDTAETGGPPCASAAAATDPLLRDSDGDRVLDGAECALETDPTSSTTKPTQAMCGANVDSDGDRLKEWAEFCGYNTSDSNTDTDGDLALDGANDGCEAASLNGDRVVNSGDQLLMVIEILRELSPSLRLVSYDINKDGAVNAGDQLLLAQFISPSGQCP